MKLVLSDLWAVSRGPAFALEDAPASFRLEPLPPIFTNRHEAEQEARRRTEAPSDTPLLSGRVGGYAFWPVDRLGHGCAGR